MVVHLDKETLRSKLKLIPSKPYWKRKKRMTSRILVNGDTAGGFRVLNFVDKVKEVIAEGNRLKASMDSMSFGSDWHQVAIELGLPDPAVVSSTAAQDTWAIISTAVTALNAPQIAELSRLDQG
jgi:hypothetical protein